MPAAGKDLDAHFAQALAKRKDDRPSSVEEWSREVAELLDAIDLPGGWPARFAPSIMEST